MLKINFYDRKRGVLKVIPENLDDLWVIYNVIHRGDNVYAKSSRVLKVEEDGARPAKGKRVMAFIGICVEKASFERGSNRLRISGVIVKAPEKYSIIGSHHTLNIPIRTPLTISKKSWLSYDINRIKADSKKNVTPIIIASIDSEEASVTILKKYDVDTKIEIRANLPSKRETTRRDKATKKYFNSILKALNESWSSSHGLIAIIGPGFLKKNFAKYIRDKQPAIYRAIKAVISVGSGGITGVNEAIRSGVLNKVGDEIRVIEETMAINSVLSKLGSQEHMVSYGLIGVEEAINYGAVELLLIADKMLREAEDAKRLEMEKLMRRVEKMGGKIMIINTSHEAGIQLMSLGQIAALLRFQLS